MAAKRKAERCIIDGRKMKRCTGFNENGCETLIPEGGKSRCRDCLNAYARIYYEADRDRNRRKAQRRKDNARIPGDFKDCTRDEMNALITGNVNALLRCPDKHREFRKEDI